MDIRTIYLILAVVFIAAPLGVYYTSRENQDRKLMLWIGGWLLLGVGALFIGLRHTIPNILSFSVAHACFAGGYVCRTMAIKTELLTTPADFQKALKFHSTAAFLYWLIFNVMILGDVSDRLRLIFVHCCHILMFVELFWISRRVHTTFRLNGALLVAAMSAMILVGFVVRAAAHLLGIGAQDPLVASADQIAFFILLIVGFIFGNYGFVQIRLEKLWRKNRQMGEELTGAQTINRQLQEVLREKNDLLRAMSLTTGTANGGVMMSSLAHELSQPLNSMRLNVDYLKKQLHKTVELGPARSALADVITDTERLVEIVAKIRLLFQKDRQEFDRVNLREVVTAVIDANAPAMEQANIRLDHLADGDLWVWGERMQLQMLLSNLIKNAIEALSDRPDNRMLHIHGTATGDARIITIRDNGPGVPAHRRSTLFDLYTTSKDSGFGVGLWICRMVAEHHKGSIAYANAPYGGAAFTLTLPAH